MTNDDMELVRAYAADRSEQAFETLVGRYVSLVYSTAMRQVRDPHLAEEITQAVFVILARKAGKLGANTILPSWLHRTAGYCAADALKIQRRRVQREQEAYMQSQLNEPEHETWRQIAPLLDTAIARLSDKDRHAVVLRFFQNKSLNEVGSAIGANEEAAKKRVARALEKLRVYFFRHGVNSTTETIAGTISANSVIVVPAPLAKTATVMALAKGAATGAFTLALVSETLKTMTWSKVKFAGGIAVAVLIAGTFAGLGPLQDDHDDRYQLEGRLDYETSPMAGSAFHGFVRDFVLTVNGPNWAMHLVPMQDSAGSSPPQYEEVVFLNGTIYYYWYFGRVSANSAAQAQNSGGAMIYYGDSPFENGDYENIVWVGLASGYHFHQATNNEVVPLWETGPPQGPVAKIRVKAQWKLNETPPYLPKYIDYFGFPMHGIAGLPDVVSHQFENTDWTNGEIRVSQETNIDGRIFPTEYTYEQFKPNLNNSATPANSVEHQLWVTVNVRKIRLHSVPDVLPPKTDGKTEVNDFRLSVNITLDGKSKQPFEITYGSSYLSSAPRLTEKPEAAALQAYKKQLSLLHMPYVPPPER